jgi:hypothetical protein
MVLAEFEKKMDNYYYLCYFVFVVVAILTVKNLNYC